ncbi:MAG: hypothetical protein AAF485_21125, partial [Chloroflexota bacterium]
MLSEHTRKRVTILFHYQDWSGDGKIDEADYRVALDKHAAALGLKEGDPAYEGMWAALQADWHQLREHADLNDDGEVSLEEFIAYHDTMFTHNQGAIDAIAGKILEAIDSDGD